MDEGALTPGWLLALETATQVTSVAVLRGGRVVAELDQTEPRIHSERLLPAIDRVLGEAGARLADIEAFAVSIGPGSFTGLRIGLATLKGLALGDPRPVAAVPTLAALAAGAGGAEPVAALLDARRGEVYGAVYAAGSFLEAVVPESVYRPEALARLLPRPCAVVAGEGAGPAARALVEAAGGGVHRLAPDLGVARAASVGRIGLAILARGGGERAEALVPRYLRRAEAEARRLGEPLEGAV